MEAKITFKNILGYIEGNTKHFLDRFNLTPTHIQEQVAWRAEICRDDCMKENKCVYCGCNPVGKAFLEESCNKGERFPDLMGADEWESYKKNNKIDRNDTHEGI